LRRSVKSHDRFAGAWLTIPFCSASRSNAIIAGRLSLLPTTSPSPTRLFPRDPIIAILPLATTTLCTSSAPAAATLSSTLSRTSHVPPRLRPSKRDLTYRAKDTHTAITATCECGGQHVLAAKRD
jgi:hypothetical protein